MFLRYARRLDTRVTEDQADQIHFEIEKPSEEVITARDRKSGHVMFPNQVAHRAETVSQAEVLAKGPSRGHSSNIEI